ncbi:aspartate phosphatase, partial [Bacillus spizizenii]|nr:aspartate phosphatase [Bacillus spizizenii]
MINMSRLIGSSLYNLGLCSFAEEAYEKAAEYFKEGIRVYQDNGYEHSNRLLDILLMLTKTTFKMRNHSEGISWCAHGLSLSEDLNDEIMAKMFEFIHALYVDNDKEKLNSILNYLELKSMFSDLEDLAT